MTLGGVVRVTDSGLGCPDWPLCDGRVIPVFERASLVEFSHRLVGSVVGLLALAVAVLAVRDHRAERRVLIPSLVGGLLVLAAALLGAVVVWTELAWWVRLIHLGLAQGVVACMVVVTLAAWPAAVGAAPEAGRSPAWPKALLHTAVAGTFLVILSGSYMVGYGASASCDTWPLCRGSLMPEGTAFAIHMGHRLLSAMVGVVVLGAAIMALTRGTHTPVRSIAWLVIVAMVGQTLLGAWTVWADFTVAMRAAHLGGATILWAAVVGLASLHSLPGAPASSRTSPELAEAGGAAS